MTIPPVKDSTGRPAREMVGATADSPVPTGTFVRITGDEMTGGLQIKPATGDALEIFDSSNSLNAFITPAGAAHATSFAGDGTALTGVVLASEVGAASGVAALDGSGKVPLSQLPAFSLVDVFTVASQAAMLALSGAGIGDLAVRTDLSETFILSALPASTLGNWVLITPPSGVSTFNSRSGAVVPTAGDYDALNDVRYLRLIGGTMTGPIVINDANAAHVPLAIGGAASQTGNLTEWSNNTPAVVASVSPTGLGTFTGLQINGPLTVTGALTLSSPNLIFSFSPGVSGNNAIGVFSDFTGTGRRQKYTGFDEQGALVFRQGFQTIGGVVTPINPGVIKWLDKSGLAGTLTNRLEPTQNSQFSPRWVASYIAGGAQDFSATANQILLSGSIVLAGDQWSPAGASGGTRVSDAATLIVQKGTGAQDDIFLVTTQGLELPGGPNSPVTLIAGLRASGNWWQVSAPPAHNTSVGFPGETAWDGTYEYRCIATNSWQRTARGTGTW